MTRIIIVRHGETTWNEQRKIAGRHDPPLTELGIRQAKKVGKRFRDEKIDVIYTSMLQRSIDTAAHAREYHPHAEMIKSPVLNEMDWGDWEGLTMEEVERKFPEEWEQRKKDKFNFAPANGESPAVLKKRLQPFAEMLVKKHEGKTVLIVGHGGINRVLVGIFMNWDEKTISEVYMKNTAVNILEVTLPEPQLHVFNCTKHLEME